MYVYMYICIYMYVYIYVYMYVYIISLISMTVLVTDSRRHKDIPTTAHQVREFPHEKQRKGLCSTQAK